MSSIRASKKSKIPLTTCIIIFLITYFINNDFDIRYIYNYIFVAGFIASSIIFDGRICLNRVTLVYFFLVVVVIIYSFLPNSVMDPESNNHAISIILFFLCCVLSIPTKKEISRSTKLLIISAILMSVYIIIIKIMPNIYWNSVYPYLSSYTQNQAQTLMKHYSYGVPIGGSANYADYILALGLFICGGSYFSRYIEKKNEGLYIIISIVFIVGMIIQNRRSELISTIFTLLLMYSLSANFRFIELRRFQRLIFGIIIIIAGIAFMYSHGMLDRYINTFVGLSIKNVNKLETIGNGRIALWNEALHLFLEYPLVGIGWNQFRANNNISYMNGLNVHNDYLQWLCETGIIGFILIVIPTIYLWLQVSGRCRRLFKVKEDTNKEAKTYALISYGIQTFFVIMHFMDPCFYKLIFWPMFAFSIVLYNMSFLEKSK